MFVKKVLISPMSLARPNNYELRIMHNGFSQWMDFPNNYELSLCTMDFPMDGSPNNYELYIMHNGFPQWMDYPNNYELCIMHYELYCGRI